MRILSIILQNFVHNYKDQTDKGKYNTLSKSQEGRVGLHYKFMRKKARTKFNFAMEEQSSYFAVSLT